MIVYMLISHSNQIKYMEPTYWMFILNFPKTIKKYQIKKGKNLLVAESKTNFFPVKLIATQTIDRYKLTDMEPFIKDVFLIEDVVQISKDDYQYLYDQMGVRFKE